MREVLGEGEGEETSEDDFATLRSRSGNGKCGLRGSHASWVLILTIRGDRLGSSGHAIRKAGHNVEHSCQVINSGIQENTG